MATAETTFDPLDHQTADEDLAALAELVSWLRRDVPRPPIVVEVGSWAGMSTRALADAGATVHAVDHWMGNPGDRIGDVARRLAPDQAYQTFCRNMGPRLMRTVFPHRMPSALMAATWPFRVQMVYIDGDHRYQAIRSDLELWVRHIEPGGIFAGHDYRLIPDVRRAVDEAMEIDGVLGCDVWWKRV